MKNFYSTIACLLLLLAGNAVSANTIIVKGYVKYANGNAAPNVAVVISTDSTPTSIACFQVHTRYTNANGYYIDTLSCNAPINHIQIAVPNCNGTALIENVTLTNTTNSVVERNFTLSCSPTPVNCSSVFTFTKTSAAGNVYLFNSSGSNATSSSDSIIRRKWKFGDGDSLMGNIVSPVHPYAQGGVYNVCLSILTALGCEKTTCATIQVTDSVPRNCKAAFTFSSLSSNYKTTKFNSSASYASTVPNDYIISRTWKFGDGDSATGNNIDPSHTYANDGVYTVCLIIKTAAGCVSDVCKVIEVKRPKCDASLLISYLSPSATVGGYPVKFNSLQSVAATGDSIVERIYKFGNGYQIGGNQGEVVYTYPTAGTYTACLIIRTAGGCSDTTCKTVTVPGPNQLYCKAAFASYASTVNYKEIFFNSSSTTTMAGDSIISRTWKFGDGDSLTGNVVNPVHVYTHDGVFTACLIIRTANGCVSDFCKVIEIRSPKCKALLNFTYLPITSVTGGYPVKFTSSGSTAPVGDSITERIYKFGDGSTSGGNALDVNHVYNTMGTYTACLIIRTAKGCSDTTCITLIVPGQGQVAPCHANFTYVPTATSVKFNSTVSTFAPGDSITSRIWKFGDSTFLTGNIKDPLHVYAQPGVYTVCLTITTMSGCTSTECKQIIATQVNSACIPQFTYTRTAPKKVLFNSTMSWVPVNDTIIERHWEFGDGTVMNGNMPTPVKEYQAFGIYTVCLRIKTIKGCINTVCMPVRVGDSVNATTVEPIKIISMYPQPAHTQLSTVVWSQFNNINATLAVYDIYGVLKWSTTKALLQGNNFTVVPVSNLLPGPYFFRVTTLYGVKSKVFYKL